MSKQSQTVSGSPVVGVAPPLRVTLNGRTGTPDEMGVEVSVSDTGLGPWQHVAWPKLTADTASAASTDYTDIRVKLEQVQKRRLVAVLCRRTGHSRAWFYKVLDGKASVLADLPILDDVLSLPDAAADPINAIRVAAGVEKKRLAELLGISRQALHSWEEKPTAERLLRVRGVLGASSASQ